MDYDCKTCGFLQDELPVTEASNPLSQDIDVCRPEEIAVVFDRIDHEIYGLECRCSHGILDENTAKGIDFLSAHLSSKLKASDCNDGLGAKRATLIFSGSGTSGRLGFLTCRTFSAYLNKFMNLEYLISGGDKSLITSNEGIEDDSLEGVECIRKALAGEQDVILIGITCGLHSPFVGGQLDYILSNESEDFIGYPVLLGFNHVEQASRTSINKSKKSFYNLALDMSRSEKQALVINPVLGPEFLTGSSRMKGGTATKIILDSLMISLLSKAKLGQTVPFAKLGQLFKNSLKLAYQDKGTLSSLIRLAGNSLHQGGHLYYVGLDSYGNYGILDSTECVPTFGAAINDVRGFVANGYDCFGNKEGDLSGIGSQYEISLEYFRKFVEPELTKHDCVILIGTSVHVREMKKLAAGISKHDSTVGFLLVNCVSQSALNWKAMTYPTIWLGEDGLEEDCRKCFSGADRVVQECATLLHRCILELALKLVLNALSTGAFILCGKVLRNFMIDIKVANTKLFHRATRIVSQFTTLSLEKSTQLLLRALHRTDILTPEIRSMTVRQHAELGENTDKVVPVAILMGLAACSVKEALELLARASSVRKCLSSFLEGEDRVTEKEACSQMISTKWNAHIMP